MIRTDKTFSHYFLVITLSTLFYPVWKGLAFFNLVAQEPFYFRLIPFLIGVSFLTLCKFKPKYDKYSSVITIILSCLILMEYLYLTSFLKSTPFYENYIIGSLIITSGFLNCFRTKKGFLVYLSIAITSFIVFFAKMFYVSSAFDDNHHALLITATIIINGFVAWKNIETNTFLKKMGEEIDKHRAQLIHSSKLASLGEMAGGIAHEINNPLQIISGNIEILEAMPDNLESISIIKNTVVRIKSVVDGLRLFSQDSENTAKEPTLILDVFNETLSFCSEKFKNNGIHLEYNIDPEVYIKCNHVDMSRVFLNLLNNAFDAIVEENNLTNRFVNISSEISDQKIILKFRDSGKIITPELKDKIFNPYFTTKSLGKGTGIGLSLSKGIIENHGGKLDLLLDPKEFVIELPINDL
jgi:signal transduction histidine kinase